MVVKKLTFLNFKRFTDVSVSFSPRMTVLVGINGAGKTNILQALSILLSWYARRMISPQANGNGQLLTQEMITHGKDVAKIGVEVEDSGRVIEWDLGKAAKGARLLGVKSDLSELNEHIKQLRSFQVPTELPILAFYTVNRAVLDVPHRIRKHHQFLRTDIYDHALDGQIDFRSFFEWFREMEDKENERIVEKYKVKDLSYSSASPLQHVRKALKSFLPEFRNWRIKRQPMRFCADKQGETFDINELSDGEKCTIALVGDISRKLIQANPNAESPLSGAGIVMIDEVELHLHPAWQTQVLPQLMKTFPHLQFIVTTHSNLVLAQLNAEIYRERNTWVTNSELSHMEPSIRVYQLENGHIDSLQDPETGLIMESKMDDAVIAVDEEFDRLLSGE